MYINLTQSFTTENKFVKIIVCFCTFFIFVHFVDYLRNRLSAVAAPSNSVDNREFTVVTFLVGIDFTFWDLKKSV